MSKNYTYLLRCELCGYTNEKQGVSRSHDWSIFHASIREIIQKGFTFVYCASQKCEFKVTNQKLIAFDGQRKNGDTESDNNEHGANSVPGEET